MTIWAARLRWKSRSWQEHTLEHLIWSLGLLFSLWRDSERGPLRGPDRGPQRDPRRGPWRDPERGPCQDHLQERRITSAARDAFQEDASGP